MIPGVLLIIFLVTVYRKIQLQVPSLTDFSGAYYPAGKLVTENPEQLYKLSNIDIFGFVNIPIVAYLFVPFSWLDPTTAKVAFTFLGIVAFITALGVMIKHFEIRGWS
ncbi:MAG: hypothetical protein VKN72_25525, partial [Nostocales cyanobacterium 94392]|nr:hypothetical protein [Nostocales cyanobacterium 94392]